MGILHGVDSVPAYALRAFRAAKRRLDAICGRKEVKTAIVIRLAAPLLAGAQSHNIRAGRHFVVQPAELDA